FPLLHSPTLDGVTGCGCTGNERHNLELVVTTNKKTVKKSSPSGKHKQRVSATAASILEQAHIKTANARPLKVKVKPEWTKYHENLLELRDRLLNQMNGLAKE